MGAYINTPEMGWRGKADILIRKYQATEMSSPNELIEPDEVVVSVVDNGPFEAAAVAYSQSELVRFQHPNDDRPKRWLRMPRTEAAKHVDQGYEKLVLQSNGI